ncbi:MAG: glycerate kinase [Beijerinckiaceae bacterium]|nr:glycerate kinase [Beijerinckiaceae bacterium]
MFEGMKIRTRRRHCLSIFEAAVQAVSPARFLPAHLPVPPETGRLFLMGAGKAAASMAAAAEAHYLDTIGFPRERLRGLVATRHGYGVPTRVVTVIEAGHPVPDSQSEMAANALLRLADEAGAGDLVVFLASGGASANLVLPVSGITLEEKKAFNKALLRSGAPIDAMNTVRKHISGIKGGRLAARIAPARLETIALSDVPGDDLATIGSGPTLPDITTLADARAVIERYRITVPDSVRAALEDPANETLKPGDPAFDGSRAVIAARPLDAFTAACAEAEALGYRVINLGNDLEGEARDIAVQHAAVALREAQGSERIALLSGGELTVTIRGDGTGGPNQEYALALAMALGGTPDIVALSADTDGTDGGAGKASDPAGALVDPTTLTRAETVGLDPLSALERNDSTPFFAALEDLLQTGPTLTNANDLRVILLGP